MLRLNLKRKIFALINPKTIYVKFDVSFYTDESDFNSFNDFHLHAICSLHKDTFLDILYKLSFIQVKFHVYNKYSLVHI